MTIGAVVMMSVAWAVILGLCGYCFYRIFSE